LSFSDALISLPYTEERNQWQGGSYYSYKAGAEEKKYTKISIGLCSSKYNNCVAAVFIELVKWIY